ncbi:MAG TPA: Holliday junction resolvase RuvX [Candidatus Gracilibacteria bacterium]
MSKQNKAFLQNLQTEHEHQSSGKKAPEETLLGIDYGEKHTGLAIYTNGVILPLDILNTGYQILNTLAEICSKRKIDRVIWGLPIGVNGEENHICEQIRKISEKVHKKTSLPFELVNERYSTSLTSKPLIRNTGPLIRAGIEERTDDLAAMRILEFYLNLGMIETGRPKLCRSLKLKTS